MNSTMVVEAKDLETLRRQGAYKHRSEFPPPGPEVPVGAMGRTALEGLGTLERIINESNLLPAAFLEEGAVRQKAVARLPKLDPSNPLGTPWGTGFLVSPSLIMTNNHVIGSATEAQQILVQFNYQVDFEGVAKSIDTWRLNPASFFYTNAALDFTLVRVKAKVFPLLGGSELSPELAEVAGDMIQAPALPYKTAIPPLTKAINPGWKWGYLPLSATMTYAAGQLLNCVQHPAGRMKELALQKNDVTHVFADRIHYTTDTEPGSSGSPVFNNQWDLVALHHAAGDPDPAHPGKWLDNEGMRIDSITTHLRIHFEHSNPALLTELGIS